MPYIIVFSLTIGLWTMTHSIGILLWWIVIIVWLCRYAVWKFTPKDTILSLVLVGVALLSVVFYDYRVLWSRDQLVESYQGLSWEKSDRWDEEWLVVSRERAGRYTLQDQTDPHIQLLLYSTESLNPGDIILSNAKPKWRNYNPELCFMICRQSGQVFDTSPSHPTILKNNGTSFDYERWLYMQSIEWSLYDDTVFVAGQKSLWWLDTVRENFFQKVVERFGGGLLRTSQWQDKSDTNIHAWLMLGMTIGDRSLIDKVRYDQYISSGLVHLIAVSGGNIAIVVLFIGMLLFWVPFYIRQVVLIGVVISYAMIVWDDSSVIRATVMWLLTLIALFPWRQLSIWRSLMYARCGMLLYNPYYLVYDMWFLLSFFAVIGIVWAEKSSSRMRGSLWWDTWRFLPAREWQKAQEWRLFTTMTKGLHHLRTLYIVPTLWAMVGVTPWLLRSMGQINLFSPLVNIMIVPLVPLITIGSFVAPYLPSWMWGDTLIVWCMQYIGWLSMIGTKYGIYFSLSVWAKYILLVVMVGYWVWWIDKEGGKGR